MGLFTSIPDLRPALSGEAPSLPVPLLGTRPDQQQILLLLSPALHFHCLCWDPLVCFFALDSRDHKGPRLVSASTFVRTLWIYLVLQNVAMFAIDRSVLNVVKDQSGNNIQSE